MNNGDFDLAAWNFAEDFSALEVIGLIFGKFNHELLTSDEKKPVYDRMKKANISAQKMIEDAFLNADIPFEGDLVVAIPDRDPMNLHSLVNEKARLCPTYDAFAFSAIERFEKARFGRDEIHRWLQAIGATSKYAFALPNHPTALTIKDDKPLGTRERNTLLTMIGLLCEGAGHDLSKHSKTAVAIKSAASLKGVEIGESTIKGHLKNAESALGAKTK